MDQKTINLEIEKLKNQQKDIDNLIDLLKKYESLSLFQYVKLTKTTDVYWKREQFAEDIRNTLKSKTLKESKIKVGVNYITIYVDTRNLKIPMFNSNTIEINYESELNCFSCEKLIKKPDISNKELIDKIDKLKISIENIEKEIKQLKIWDILKKGNLHNQMEDLYHSINKINTEIEWNNDKNEQIKHENQEINKLIKGDRKFLEHIQEDINYFINEGFEVDNRLAIKLNKEE